MRIVQQEIGGTSTRSTCPHQLFISAPHSPAITVTLAGFQLRGGERRLWKKWVNPGWSNNGGGTGE